MRWQEALGTCALDQAPVYAAAVSYEEEHGIGLYDDGARSAAVGLEESGRLAALPTAAVGTLEPPCSSERNWSGDTGVLRYCARTKDTIGR